MKARAFLIALALSAGPGWAACEVVGGTDLSPVPQDALTAAAHAAEVSPSELATAPGEITAVRNADTGLTCVALDTPLTCSNGVVVCAHVVLAGDDLTPIWSDAGHVVSVDLPQDGQVTIRSRIDGPTGPRTYEDRVPLPR